MQPFERLRAVARWDDDDLDLVSEAAACLADFAEDPAGLVIACRRLLAHHPHHGALWWLCARVLAAADPRTAAYDAIRALDHDTTGRRLAELIPMPSDDLVVSIGWSDAVSIACEARPDIEFVALRSASHDPVARLRRRGDTARVVDRAELAARTPSVVIAQPHAIGGAEALISDDVTPLRDELRHVGVTVFLSAPVGTVLASRLFDAVVSNVGPDASLTTTRLADWDGVIGPWGLDTTGDLSTRSDTPVPPELLRRLEPGTG